MSWFKSLLNAGKRDKLGMPPADSVAPDAGRFQCSQPEDLYARLGVKPTASPSEIRRAYRARAKVFHPDVNPDDSLSEDAFKLVSEAFAILSDVESRRRYDQSRLQHGQSQSGRAMHNRFPGQFARGFLSGILTVSCLVPVILLVNAMRKEDIRAASAISIPTEGAAAHEVGTLQKRERASHEMVHVQTGRASVKQERTGTLPPKDADAEITAGASPTDADTSNSRKPANSRLDVVGHERPAKADTSADAKPIAPAVGMRERHHDRKANPPTKTLDGTLEVAHVDANADDGELSPQLTAAAGPQPVPLLPSKAGRRQPADSANVKHVRSVVTRQVKAFRRQAGYAAFALASPAVQSKFRGAREFLKMVETSYPEIPASKTASFLGLVRTRDKVIARFLLEGSNGRSVEARYHMVRLAGRWRIDGCVIVPR